MWLRLYGDGKEKNSMNIIQSFSVLFLPIFVLTSLLLVDGFGPSLAENSELSTVVFYVQ
jgi:hypothetical protein